MKVILVHDWLNGMRGGEKCLELLCDVYPEAPIYTLFCQKDKISKRISSHPIESSWLQKVPGFVGKYRAFLPCYPAAIESFRLPPCDVVLSFSHCAAKGIPKRKNSVHICYCFTPMRYAWGFFDDYFGNENIFSKFIIKFFLKKLRHWDLSASRRVDHFVAISQHIRNRIQACYGRDSEVIYPPANTQFYSPDHRVDREDYYLVVSALVPYKKIDLAVRAVQKMKKKLVVIGEGPEKARLMAMAGPDVKFLGWQPNEVLRDYYRRAKALLFPGEEDFGIVPVEVQACGGRVIAYAKGGTLETVLDRETGVFFNRPTVESFEEAIRRFESLSWDPDEPRRNALRFSEERFIMEMKNFIQRKRMGVF